MDVLMDSLVADQWHGNLVRSVAISGNKSALEAYSTDSPMCMMKSGCWNDFILRD
jgi:hypothetical protein